jgi:hypothetical protein
MPPRVNGKVAVPIISTARNFELPSLSDSKNRMRMEVTNLCPPPNTYEAALKSAGESISVASSG